jgi:hypothetical protein
VGPTGRVSLKLDVLVFIEIHLETPNMAILGRDTIEGTLHADPSGFHIVGSDTYRATIQITHCCASIATLAIFITSLTAEGTPTIQRIRAF